jgi:hypothetical protein
MEAVLLMLEVIAISQILVWAARGRGDGGLLGWKSHDKPVRTTRPAGRTRRS